MPTSVSIDPVLGHGVVAVQDGVTEYDAIDDRRVRGIGRQTGVLTSDDFVVTSGPGALQVTVSSSGGEGACIRGVNVTAQGLYYVAPPAADIVLDLSPGDATNPRLDQIVVEVLDATHDGGGAYDALVSVEEGTPAAGADLDNRNGAVDLTGRNVMVVHDIVVPAAATDLSGASFRDRRPIEDEDWHVVGDPGEPAYQNGWAGDSSGGAYVTARFRREGRILYLDGRLAGTSQSTPAFTLPPTHRPAKSKNYVATSWNGTTIVPYHVTVDESGGVKLNYPVAVAQAYITGCIPLD